MAEDEVPSEEGGFEETPGEGSLSRVEELEAQVQANLDMAKRIQADFDNYRKRSQRDMESFRSRAEEALMSDMLPLLDDLQRALGADADPEQFREGVMGIMTNLESMLETHGLSEIPTGGTFDPSLHEAICATEGDEDGRILEEYQKGYFLGDRVLRYSKVRVSKRKESE